MVVVVVACEQVAAVGRWRLPTFDQVATNVLSMSSSMVAADN